MLGDASMLVAAQRINLIRMDQQRRGEQSFIDTRYDIKFIFSPVEVHRNILIRTHNALVRMLNQNVKLLKHITVIFDDDFHRITGGYKMTEKAIGCFTSGMVQVIAKRKKDLLPKAYHRSEPKIIFMKPTVKPNTWPDDRVGGLNQCRIFNRCLEMVISKYDGFYFYNVNEIRPEKHKCFDRTNDHLLDKAMKSYWRAMNEVIRKIDYNNFLMVKELVRVRGCSKQFRKPYSRRHSQENRSHRR